MDLIEEYCPEKRLPRGTGICTAISKRLRQDLPAQSRNISPTNNPRPHPRDAQGQSPRGGHGHSTSRRKPPTATRSCGSSNATPSCRPSTATGATISPRWTNSAPASACAPTTGDGQADRHLQKRSVRDVRADDHHGRPRDRQPGLQTPRKPPRDNRAPNVERPADEPRRKPIRPAWAWPPVSPRLPASVLRAAVSGRPDRVAEQPDGPASKGGQAGSHDPARGVRRSGGTIPVLVAPAKSTKSATAQWSRGRGRSREEGEGKLRSGIGRRSGSESAASGRETGRRCDPKTGGSFNSPTSLNSYRPPAGCVTLSGVEG